MSTSNLNHPERGDPFDQTAEVDRRHRRDYRIWNTGGDVPRQALARGPVDRNAECDSEHCDDFAERANERQPDRDGTLIRVGKPDIGYRDQHEAEHVAINHDGYAVAERNARYL